jgi:hypothetical protein
LSFDILLPDHLPPEAQNWRWPSGKDFSEMHVGEKDEGSKNKSLVESLSRQFHSQAYPVRDRRRAGVQVADGKGRPCFWRFFQPAAG